MGVNGAAFGAFVTSVAAVTIGTNTATSSAGSAKRPSFAARIQLNRCCELYALPIDIDLAPMLAAVAEAPEPDGRCASASPISASPRASMNCSACRT